MKHPSFFLLLFLFFAHININAQEIIKAEEVIKTQETNIDSLIDLLLFEDDDIAMLLSGKKKFHFLYARTNFENNTFFAGRDIGIDQQNYSAQLSYFNSNGIYAGLGSIWYSAFDPKLYATSLSLGYSGKIKKNKDYRYRASYDRYFFSKVDSIEERSFNSSLNIGATIDKGFIGSRLDYSLLMGNERASQISWDLYGDITLFKLGSGRFDKIKFEPAVSLYFGTEEVAYYEYGGRRPWDYSLVEDSQFGLLNTEIMLPLTVSYKDFDFEIGYNINVPTSNLTDEKYPVTTYFNISLGYIFSLN